MPNLRVLIAFCVLCLSWGSSYLFIRIGVRDLSPLSLVAMRLTIGAAVIWAVVAIRRQDLRVSTRQAVLIPSIATLNIAAPFLLIAWGETSVPSGLASVLNSTVPIFSVLLAGFVLHDEPLTLPRLGGVSLGFLGVVVLFSGDLVHGSRHWSTLAGEGAIVLSSICYAVGAVLVRHLLRGVAPMTLAAYSVSAVALETVVVSLIFSPPPFASMPASAWLSVVWLGVFGSGLAYLLAFFILTNWGAARYTLVAQTLPIVGLALGAIFLKERLDWRIVVGSLLVIGGVVLAGVARWPSRSATPVQAAVD
jgi:drug/metabolite transporter (DMT)-like permease